MRARKPNWKDVPCQDHGRLPAWRITYDFKHCAEKGCWEAVIGRAGLAMKSELDAAREEARELRRERNHCLSALEDIAGNPYEPTDFAHVSAARKALTSLTPRVQDQSKEQE